MAERMEKEPQQIDISTAREADDIDILIYKTSKNRGWSSYWMPFLVKQKKGYKQECLLSPLTEAEQTLLTCPNCEGILRDPVMLKKSETKKIVCEECARGRDVSDWQQGRDSINKLNAKCPLESRGCNWRGKLNQIERHLSEDCSRLLIDCELGCGEVLLRKDKEEHRNLKCDHRIIPCQHCGDNLKAFQHEKHYQICPEMEVTCPNNCEKHGKMKRRLLNSHLSSDCPLAEIPCEYSRFGCDVSTRRQDMSQHLELHVHKHLALVTQMVLKQEERFADLGLQMGRK